MAQEVKKLDMQPVDLTPIKIEKTETPEDHKSFIERQKAIDAQIVKGVFRYHMHPGSTNTFVYKKYKGERVKKYIMTDGYTYSIPLGVAKHINNDCWYPQHKYQLNENGKQESRQTGRIKRCGFESLEFHEIDGLDRGGSPVIRLENAAVSL